jgi:mono/diheme cytochrome c family protein
MHDRAFITFCKARLLAGGVLAVAWGMAGAGCATQANVAPAVTTAMLGPGRGGTLETLSEGRRIFVGPCARCHAPDPLNRFSFTEWQANVEKMAPRAKLDASGKASLLAYIAAAKSAPAVAQQR